MTENCPLCQRPLTRDPGFAIDLTTNCVVVDGRRVSLTGKHAEIVQVLYDAMPRVVSKPALMAAIYPHEEPEWRTLDCFVMQIRRRLAKTRIRIVTHWGAGYQLVLDRIQGTTPLITYGTGRVARSAAP